MAQDVEILNELYKVILSRRGTDPDKSYTAKLFSRGRGKIAQKFGEESVETIVAALSEGRDELAAESADMLYHLLVLWADCGLEPGKVWAELERRLGTSGIDEKKSRAKKS
ncbi:phosphoribosyl-ATP diphosphatase [Magnetospirillum molischianum]|uniref:Phosphoribosyl-ATP pyrophosphatase n=1 Tax=Magnetospirillum molischianum DSM 120 TaxID=1150626 RepID=H8FTQ7_MAGML|nr:phosphoribosyl-ATP diphosphatase [Magnetospirillum molischianum]CCG41764.1 Phosphoribosyl-ATP pyrophosphatase [Magnetospirillum molischianum DSM 120]